MRNRKFSRIWLPKLVSLRSEIAFDNQVILSLHKSIRKIRDMHTSKCLELDECIVKVKRLEEALKLEQSKTRAEDAKDCFNEAMLDEQAKIIKELKESSANITHSLEISKKAGRAATELIGGLKRDVEKWKNAAVVSVCINVVVVIMLFAIVNGG